MPPYPKHESVRARKNKSSTATELVIRNPDEYVVPEPPENWEIVKEKDADGNTVERRVKKDWHPEALHFWEEAYTSPMSDQWVRGEHAVLRQLMLLQQALWEAAERGKTGGLAMITAENTRLMKQMGLTMMGRRSLQLTVAQTAETITRIQGGAQGSVSGPRFDALGSSSEEDEEPEEALFV